MIQRIQSFLLFITTISLCCIVYLIPFGFGDDNYEVFISDDYGFVYFALLLSSFLCFYTIFQFKNRKKQLLLVRFNRLIITICVVVWFFFDYENFINESETYRYNTLFILFFIFPYVTLLLSAYFIKKDEELVRSADRIR